MFTFSAQLCEVLYKYIYVYLIIHWVSSTDLRNVQYSYKPLFFRTHRFLCCYLWVMITVPWPEAGLNYDNNFNCPDQSLIIAAGLPLHTRHGKLWHFTPFLNVPSLPRYTVKKIWKGSKRRCWMPSWNFKQSLGARNRVGIGLSNRPARLHRLAELISLESSLGLLKSLKFRAQEELKDGWSVVL